MSHKETGVNALEAAIEALEASKAPSVPCGHCGFFSPDALQAVTDNNSIDLQIRELRTCIEEVLRES